MPRGIPKLQEMDPFHREQFVAKVMYEQLMTLDRPSRRRVLGIVNDYAMQAEKYVKAPKQENGAPFNLDDEEE